MSRRFGLGWDGLKVLSQEAVHDRGDFGSMRFEREMACVKQMDMSLLQVAFVGFSAGWQEGRVMTPPDGEEGRLMLPEYAWKKGYLSTLVR
jgi:hypothetical protein